MAVYPGAVFRHHLAMTDVLRRLAAKWLADAAASRRVGRHQVAAAREDCARHLLTVIRATQPGGPMSDAPDPNDPTATEAADVVDLHDPATSELDVDQTPVPDIDQGGDA